MKRYGNTVFGILAVSGVFIVCSLALSTAGVADAAIWFSGLAVVMILIGFYFAFRYHHAENALWRKKMLVAKPSAALLSQAAESFDAWRQAEDNRSSPDMVQEAKDAAISDARQAVFALREIEIPQKTLALSALHQAVEAQNRWMNLQETGATEEALEKARRNAEECALQAVAQLKEVNLVSIAGKKPKNT